MKALQLGLLAQQWSSVAAMEDAARRQLAAQMRALTAAQHPKENLTMQALTVKVRGSHTWSMQSSPLLDGWLLLPHHHGASPYIY